MWPKLHRASALGTGHAPKAPKVLYFMRKKITGTNQNRARIEWKDI